MRRSLKGNPRPNLSWMYKHYKLRTGTFSDTEVCQFRVTVHKEKFLWQ